jgi:hypothetical protein
MYLHIKINYESTKTTLYMIIRYSSYYASKAAATEMAHSSFLSLCLVMVFVGGTNDVDLHFLTAWRRPCNILLSNKYEYNEN